MANTQPTRVSQILDKPKHESLGYCTANPSFLQPSFLQFSYVCSGNIQNSMSTQNASLEAQSRNERPTHSSFWHFLQFLWVLPFIWFGEGNLFSFSGRNFDHKYDHSIISQFILAFNEYREICRVLRLNQTWHSKCPFRNPGSGGDIFLKKWGHIPP